MKSIKLVVNNEEPIILSKDGIKTIIVMCHQDKTTITASGLLKNSEGKNNITWLDQELSDDDVIAISTTENQPISKPKSEIIIDQQTEDERSLNTYFQLQKMLKEKNLI